MSPEQKTALKWELLTIAIVVILVLLAKLVSASGDDAIHAEFDSDIGKLGEQIRELDNLLSDVRVDIAKQAQHGHVDYEDRLRLIEAELEQLHGVMRIVTWICGALLLGVPAILSVIQYRKTHK